MNPVEIVELVKKSNPKLLGKIPDAKAAGIIRAALIQLVKHINAADEGTVNVSGLGNFKIKQVEREKDGQKKMVKVIAFRAAKEATKEEKQAKKLTKQAKLAAE